MNPWETDHLAKVTMQQAGQPENPELYRAITELIHKVSEGERERASNIITGAHRCGSYHERCCLAREVKG